MGGFFSPQQQTSPVVTGGGPAAIYQPFAAQLAQAVGNLFNHPVGGQVTPLEQGTIMNTFRGAMPGMGLLSNQAGGGTIPTMDAQGNPTAGNPFLQGTLGAMGTQADLARRQLASAAQRSGALNSTDYLTQSRLLETNLANQRDQLLLGQYNTGVGQQQGAAGLGMNLSNALLGMAGMPRQVATDATLQPFQMGLQLLGPFAGGSQMTGGQTSYSPSPFAGLLGAAAGAYPWFHPTAGT